MKNYWPSKLVFIKAISLILNLSALVIIGTVSKIDLINFVSILGASIVLSSVLDFGENNYNLKRTLPAYEWQTNLYFSFNVRITLLSFIIIISFLSVFLIYTDFQIGISVVIAGISNVAFMRVRTIYWRNNEPLKALSIGEFVPSFARFIIIIGYSLFQYSIFYVFIISLLLGIYIINMCFKDGIYDLLPLKINQKYLIYDNRSSKFIITYLTSILLALKDQIVNILIVKVDLSMQTYLIIYTRILVIVTVMITPKLAQINSTVNSIESSKLSKRLTNELSRNLILLILIINISLGLYLNYTNQFDFKYIVSGIVTSLSLITIPFITLFLAQGKSGYVLLISMIVTLINILWWF